MKKDLQVVDLGLAGYRETWDLQKEIFDRRLSGDIGDVLLLCEHPNTYTVGKNGVDHVSRHLRMNREQLEQYGIGVYEIDRGGDITYHGPGQLVGYPILNLNDHYRDVHRYLRDLEETIIRTLADFGIEGLRIKDITGVWINGPRGPEKICAIGVKVTRWITMHGFAFNVNTNLDFFGGIVPCGITDKGVTSLQALAGHPKDMPGVKARLIGHFAEIFNLEAVPSDAASLIRTKDPVHA